MIFTSFSVCRIILLKTNPCWEAQHGFMGKCCVGVSEVEVC